MCHNSSTAMYMTTSCTGNLHQCVCDGPCVVQMLCCACTLLFSTCCCGSHSTYRQPTSGTYCISRADTLWQSLQKSTVHMLCEYSQCHPGQGCAKLCMQLWSQQCFAACSVSLHELRTQRLTSRSKWIPASFPKSCSAAETAAICCYTCREPK